MKNRTNEEIIIEIESEIKMTGSVGLNISVLKARLDYAESVAKVSLRNIQTVYESIGNDLMAERMIEERRRLSDVMGRTE